MFAYIHMFFFCMTFLQCCRVHVFLEVLCWIVVDYCECVIL
jgi:hypothetical protein